MVAANSKVGNQSRRLLGLVPEPVLRWLRLGSRTSTMPLDSGDGTLQRGSSIARMVGHDLRNELTVAIACADEVRRLVPSGPAHDALVELCQRTDRALLMSRELLGTSARPPTARTPIDLNHVITQAAPALHRLTESRIRLQLWLSQRPLVVIADRYELERILLNLVLNAREAIDDTGGIVIQTAAHDVAGRGGSPQRMALVTVRDTGCGMTPEVRARIFEPFFTTRACGTGLGLSSIADTVRELGGLVSVATRPRLGTSMTVHLPRISAHVDID